MHNSDKGFQYVPESALWLADNTIGDASTARHGFLKKLSGSVTEYMRGDGSWATPVGTSGGSAVQYDVERYIFGEDVPTSQGTNFGFTFSIANMTNGATGSGTLAGANDTVSRAVQYSTGGTNNSISGRRTNVGTSGHEHIRRDWQPIIGGSFQTGADLTNIRLWFGAWDGADTTLCGATDPSGLDIVAFRFDSSADTNFTCCCKDTSTLATADSGVTPATSTDYRYRIDMTASGSVDFYLNDSLVGTVSSNLPTSTTYLGWGIFVRNLAAENKSFLYRKMWSRHNVGA